MNLQKASFLTLCLQRPIKKHVLKATQMRVSVSEQGNKHLAGLVATNLAACSARCDITKG